MDIANPVPWSLLELEDVPDHRLDECYFYDECLTYAARINWPGFSCSFCLIFNEERERKRKGKVSLMSQLGQTKRRDNEEQRII